MMLPRCEAVLFGYWFIVLFSPFLGGMLVLGLLIGVIFSKLLSFCCDISEKNVMVLLIFGTVIRYHVLLMLVK